MMLFTDVYKDLREKRDRKIREENFEIGKAEGRAEERRLWSIFLAAYQQKIHESESPPKDTPDSEEK